MDIILASQSPRRKQLLEILGIDFKIISSNFDENLIEYKNNPEDFCKDLAIKKAETVSQANHQSLTIGADTIVVLNNQLLQKPKDKIEAVSFLNQLSQNTHQVYTGISLIYKNNINSFSECTSVTFGKLSSNEIQYYVENSNPLDKAGAYGIQDWSSIFVKKIEGCYFNVVGFPISRFYSEILKLYPKIIENLLVTKIENA